MIDTYSEKFFINQAIECGIRSYILNKKGEHYKTVRVMFNIEEVSSAEDLVENH